MAAVVDSFLHSINLPFHEAGHIIFAPFGHTMMVLGGSLMQVLVPAICAGAFLFQNHDQFGAALCVWWMGENLLDLAPYIDDARSLQLMLLGGPADEVEGHDWEALLEPLQWLHLDHTHSSHRRHGGGPHPRSHSAAAFSFFHQLHAGRTRFCCRRSVGRRSRPANSPFQILSRQPRALPILVGPPPALSVFVSPSASASTSRPPELSLLFILDGACRYRTECRGAPEPFHSGFRQFHRRESTCAMPPLLLTSFPPVFFPPAGTLAAARVHVVGSFRAALGQRLRSCAKSTARPFSRRSLSQ